METMHLHAPSEYERRHSVGQLNLRQHMGEHGAYMHKYRVHVPLARGRVMPEILSMSDDWWRVRSQSNPMLLEI
jgi:hypothetical protein